MYNLLTLTACLAPLLAFRQPPEASPDEPQLAAGLLIADGQVAVQDVHPLLTLANLRAVAPQVPGAGTDIGAQLSAYLDQARRAAVAKVLAAFTARKKLTGTGKTLLADGKLTGQHGEYRRKVIKQGRFVGLALRPAAGKDVLVSVTGLGTQFTDLNPNFRLYLYHSSSQQPVAQYEVPRANKVYFEWTPIAIALPLGADVGEYRLGYFEDDLVGQAVDLQRDFSQRPGSCCGSDYLLFDAYAPYVQVRGFTTPAEEGTDVLPGDGRVSYVSDSNFGLNLQVSVVCDLSEYFCRHKALFAEALQLQLAADLLSQMANTTRNNGLASGVQALALVELNNRPDYQPGLLSRLEKALGALDVDLSGISKPCLPCKTNGYKVGAV
ncbi:hypothetical protein HHL22_20600 [Hymenobacter sp. RP-2-7]|uniref:Uncharacterized protein n=1 Tax=Hymenobacter polaris TaxID=2682546 RepID=A0A7Y0AHS5_9BACT|nr:hypothetical protein [Hymenobacter polaris]NML67608.1 hypothetical protein [Hymenobacter polaris]